MHGANSSELLPKHISGPLFDMPFCAYRHNSKTEGRIRPLQLSNDSSTTGDTVVLEYYAWYSFMLFIPVVMRSYNLVSHDSNSCNI